MAADTHIHTCPQCGGSEVEPGLKCGCTHAVKGEGLKVMEELWRSGAEIPSSLSSRPVDVDKVQGWACQGCGWPVSLELG